MPKFNDIDLENWKDCDVFTDSLWIIDSRDNVGKHDGFYHGNFVPQIPRQFIKRYTKKGETVLDMFCGSGTTNIEAEMLERNCIAVELQQNLVDLVNGKLDKDKFYVANDGEQIKLFNDVICGDSSSDGIVDKIKLTLNKYSKKKVQLVILHPPYNDIIKFSNNPKDLSNYNKKDFLTQFYKVLENAYELLEKDRYLIIVIGDKYQNEQWHPLGFECMNLAQLAGFTLKSIIVKNMSGNRGKANQNAIWRYRALSSDYYIFKHEYIFVLKKN